MIIGITIGDPAGIGAEIAIKACLDESVNEICSPVLIGSALFVEQVCSCFFDNITINSISSFDQIKNISNVINVYNVSNLDINSVKIGKDSKIGGSESILYLNQALNLINSKKINAIVTCPISKNSIAMAGYEEYPGHTEFFAKNTNTKEYLMFFYAEDIRVALVTTHIPLDKVSSNITTKKILKVIDIIVENKSLFIEHKNFKIAVCGLNPHAGENGILGVEEKDIIMPAILKTKAKGIDIQGPFPSDTLFANENYKNYDFIIAMYHDQGLIPFKMLAFDRGVNVTLGLPFIRTSVDHGTAYNIAGKGIADFGSLKEAIKLAVNMKKRNL